MVTNASEAVVNPFQQALLVEDWRTAIDDIARLVGSRKKLALMLWPAKGSQAEGWLSDCLNPDRPAKLDPDEFIAIARIGRENGYHGLMFFICDATSYSRPSPITRDDQRDETMRAFSSAVQTVKALASQLERLGVKV